MRVLYLSHTGMTEPLGQRQVLPYLRGAHQRGAEIEIISFEPAGTPPDTVAELAARLAADGLRWRPLVRSASHAFASKVLEASLAFGRALEAAARRRVDIVHARSHLPAAVADAIVSLVPHARLLFDCRGLVGDEYVETGHWHKDGLSYRLLKRYERRFFRRAHGLVVLTESLRRFLEDRALLGARTIVSVIPCCVDAAEFRPDDGARGRARAALGAGGRLIIAYSGTLGSWYREREMVRFAAALMRRRDDAVFLVLTRAPTDGLRAAAREMGLDDDRVLVRAVPPSEMPAMLTAADVGVSFIAPCFSKLGSSPTKVAEYLACGVPAVVNEGVGDQADLAGEPGACVTVRDFSDEELDAAAERVLALAAQPFAARAAATTRVARARFGLDEVGVPRYQALYEKLCP